MSQRIIKFRAWTKRDKCWCGAFAVHMSGLWRESPNNEWTDLSKQDEIVLMQFTGLLDKNGKEIYEGDVVRENNELGISDLHYQIGYKDGHTSMTGCNKGNEYDRHGIWNMISSIEILGNIYENPELLK